MAKAEKRIRLAGILVCQLFALFTTAVMIITKQYGRLPMSLGTMLLILLPEILERIFRCRLSLGVYIFGLLYALGPMIGCCWNLYYAGIGWDKLLHAAGGVMFAIIGAFFFQLLSKEKPGALLTAIFALCFSMALSVLWEFVEYGCDILLHTDMQQDTILPAIHSYLLGDGPGVAGSLENITSTVVNGQVLATGGYVDVGLVDTMEDMLVEAAGALAACVFRLTGGITKEKR